MSKTIYIHVDAATSGCPGSASIAAVLRETPDVVLAEVAEILPQDMTNNEAEYRAILRGLAEAEAHGYGRVRLYSDSQLAVRQVEGTWACREARLGKLCALVLEKRGAFERFEVVWIPREMNRRADRLATDALDAHLGRHGRQGEFTFHNFQRLQEENQRLQEENQTLRQELKRSENGRSENEQAERTEPTSRMGSAA